MLVIDLKSGGVLKMKFVAPMPEHIATTIKQILSVRGELSYKFSAQKLRIPFILAWVQRISFLGS